VQTLAPLSETGAYNKTFLKPGSFFYACSAGAVPFGHCIGKDGTNVMRLRVDVNGTDLSATETTPSTTGAASTLQRSVLAAVGAVMAAAALLL
jgi:hypothetical protein